MTVLLEQGVVVKKNGEEMEIRMQPSAACEGCGVCFVDKSKFQVLKVNQRVDARPGDLVEVEVRPGFAIRSAFLLFFIPIVMFIVGYYLFPEVTDIPGLNAVYQGIFGGIIAMAVTYTGVHFYDKYLQNTGRGKQVRVVRVIK